MKNKLLLKAMAVALSAVCLSGCSQTPATESVTGETETETETTVTTTTEAAIEETESSTTVSEEIPAEIDISKKAIDYGMTVAETFDSAMNMRYSGTPYCYVSKDADQANTLADTYLHIASLTEFDLERFIVCSDSAELDSDVTIDLKNNPYSFAFVYQMDAKDSDSAKEIYDLGADWINRMSSYAEVKNGDNNTICYCVVDNGDVRTIETEGIYINGNTVIWVESFTNTANNEDCIDFFCKDLELESPMTLNK